MPVVPSWLLPESPGIVDEVMGRELWHWHGDTFNVHGATMLTQISRWAQRQRAGLAARAAIRASETQRLQGGN